MGLLLLLPLYTCLHVLGTLLPATGTVPVCFLVTSHQPHFHFPRSLQSYSPPIRQIPLHFPPVISSPDSPTHLHTCPRFNLLCSYPLNHLIPLSFFHFFHFFCTLCLIIGLWIPACYLLDLLAWFGLPSLSHFSIILCTFIFVNKSLNCISIKSTVSWRWFAIDVEDKWRGVVQRLNCVACRVFHCISQTKLSLKTVKTNAIMWSWRQPRIWLSTYHSCLGKAMYINDYSCMHLYSLRNISKFRETSRTCCIVSKMFWRYVVFMWHQSCLTLICTL